MQLLAATPQRTDQISGLKSFQMLRYRLPRHIKVLTQRAERLAIFNAKHIQQLPTIRISQRLEYLVSIVQFVFSPVN